MTLSKSFTGIVSNQTLSGATLTGPTISNAKYKVPFNTQTSASYTLLSTDEGQLVTLANSSPITLNLNASVFSTGAEINIAQFDVGQVSITAGTGVTILSTGGTPTAPKLRTKGSGATIICTSGSSNTFWVTGDIV